MTTESKRAVETVEPADIRVLARHIEAQLQAIRRTLRRPLETEYARGELTGPQKLVMGQLVGCEGLSLKELSRSVSLAHSTVSGIVDRLERRGLVERHVLETDRRVTQIAASPEVRRFMHTRAAELTLHPLVEVLENATAEQRQTIRKGVDTLAGLLREE